MDGYLARPMGKVVLILEAKVKPGKRDELRALWDEHLRPRAEVNVAQELYLYCYDQEDPDTVRIVELYSQPDAMQANAGADWFADYLRASAPLLAEPPKLAMGEPLWAKGVAL
jgi:quinol monooxygenase YgiN